jgi:hypothetical protein
MQKLELIGYIKTAEQVKPGWAPKGAVRVGEVGEREPWGGWVAPEDYRFVGWLDADETNPRPATISLEITPEMATLMAAYPDICYDEDSNVRPLAEEDGGNVDLEIFWAVTYRGGLDSIRAQK